MGRKETSQKNVFRQHRKQRKKGKLILGKNHSFVSEWNHQFYYKEKTSCGHKIFPLDQHLIQER